LLDPAKAVPAGIEVSSFFCLNIADSPCRSTAIGVAYAGVEREAQINDMLLNLEKKLRLRPRSLRASAYTL